MFKIIKRAASGFVKRAWDVEPVPASRLVKVLTWDEVSEHLVAVGAIPPGRHIFSDVDDGLEVYLAIEETDHA